MSSKLVGMASLKRKLERATGETHRAVEVEVKRSLVAIERGAKKRVKVDQGELRNSLAHQIHANRMGNMFSGRAGTNKVHGPPTEFGRRPGSMPPVEAIRRWAKRKGIPEDAAYAIALKIARQGTAPAPFLFPSFEEERPKFIRNVARAMDDAHWRASKG